MKWVKIVHIISGAYNLIIKPALLFFCIFLILSAHYIIWLKGNITDLAVSSNNALVASASNDFVIRVVSIPYLTF